MNSRLVNKRSLMMLFTGIDDGIPIDVHICGLLGVRPRLGRLPGPAMECTSVQIASLKIALVDHAAPG